MACVNVVKNFLAPRNSGMVLVANMVSVLYTGVLVMMTFKKIGYSQSDQILRFENS